MILVEQLDGCKNLKRPPLPGLELVDWEGGWKPPPFKFGILFSGFPLGHNMYKPLYKKKLETKVMLFVGKWDPVIPPGDTLGIVGKCKNIKVVLQ